MRKFCIETSCDIHLFVIFTIGIFSLSIISFAQALPLPSTTLSSTEGMSQQLLPNVGTPEQLQLNQSAIIMFGEEQANQTAITN